MESFGFKRIFKNTPVTILILLAVTSLNAEEVNVYFGTGGKEAAGIYRAMLDTEKGKLSAVTLAAEVGSPGFLAWSPDRTRLYAVASEGQDAVVAAYAVEANGELKLLNTAPMAAGRGAHLAVHPSGKFLITAHYGTGKVSVFPLDENGRVGTCAQIVEHTGGSQVVAKRQNAPHPHWTGFSPDGKFALVPDLGLDQIVIYQVDQEQPALKASGVAQSIPGGGPRHMKFSVDGKFIYLLNELTLSVTTFDYDEATGSASPFTTTPALSEEEKSKEGFNSASEILVHPNGKFVYSANRGHDSVTVYRANPQSGQLSVIEVEPIRGAFPRNINMDSQGEWLLAAGAESNTVSVFRIDAESGELKFQRGSVVNVSGAICILINN
jgi:6-phosphogluconolactonase